MKKTLLALVMGSLVSSSGFAWNISRVEGLIGPNNDTTLHRRCILSDSGVQIEKNIGSWATSVHRDLTRHFVATAKQLSGDAVAVQAGFNQLAYGTPVVNYWVQPDQGQGFVIRSEQFPVGAQQHSVVDSSNANEILTDFLDVACSVD